MKKLFTVAALLWASVFALAAPPSEIDIVSAPPTGTCTSNLVKMVKTSGSTGGDTYACLGGRWTRMPIGTAELSATNAVAAGLCPRASNTDPTQFEWFVCNSGGGSGGGTSIIQEGGSGTSGNVVSGAVALNFGAGFDVASDTYVASGDKATVTLDYDENPVSLSANNVSGNLPQSKGGTGGTSQASALAALLGAQRGANSDITSLTGLLTPLGLAYGGTGISTASGLDDKLLLGQSGGTTVSWAALTNCNTGNALTYNTSTNAFGCETTGGGGSGIEADYNDVDVTAAVRGRVNFVGAALTVVDDTGGTGPEIEVTLNQLPIGSTSVVGTTRTVIPGAGLNGSTGLPLSADIQLDLDTSEAASIKDLNSTQVSGAAGKMGVLDSGPISYTDGAGGQRLTAIAGNTAGDADKGDDAASFFSAGLVPLNRGGTNSSGTGFAAKDIPFIASGAYAVDTGLFTYDSVTKLFTVGAVQTVNATDGTRGDTFQDNGTPNLVAPLTNFTFLGSKAGELYKRNSTDSSDKLILTDGNVGGAVSVTVAGGAATVAILPDKITEAMLKAINTPTNGQFLSYTTTAPGDFQWVTPAGAGTVTATGGALTANAVVLGAGTTDTKVAAGLTTDGVSKVVLGVAGGAVGGVDFKNATSGTVTLTPVTGALSGTMSLPAATDTIVGKATTDTLTNKSLDVEGTGNNIYTVERSWVSAAGCNAADGAAGTSFFDLETTGQADPKCIVASGLTRGVLDFDATAVEDAHLSFILPADYCDGTTTNCTPASNAMDINIKWLAASTTGCVVWGVQTACTADGAVLSTSLSTASLIQDLAKGTTLQTNDATISNITKTGCAPGSLMNIRFFRDATNVTNFGGSCTAGDDMTGDARLIGIEIVYRRKQ